jgi:GR25 family glycosyltransferase involved in LPS biosynthesis
LNSKHRLAWANFLEGDCDLLLVLEDDARPTNHLWQEKLLESIETAVDLKSKPSIVNLAPFFHLEDLLPELTKQSDFYGQNWRSLHFYANTTAAYIINRLAAKELLTGFINSPRYNLESIDFAMMMVAVDTEIRFEYLERTPGVFQNLSQVEGDSSLGN